MPFSTFFFPFLDFCVLFLCLHQDFQRGGDELIVNGYSSLSATAKTLKSNGITWIPFSHGTILTNIAHDSPVLRYRKSKAIENRSGSSKSSAFVWVLLSKSKEIKLLWCCTMTFFNRFHQKGCTSRKLCYRQQMRNQMSWVNQVIFPSITFWIVRVQQTINVQWSKVKVRISKKPFKVHARMAHAIVTLWTGMCINIRPFWIGYNIRGTNHHGYHVSYYSFLKCVQNGNSVEMINVFHGMCLRAKTDFIFIHFVWI